MMRKKLFLSALLAALTWPALAVTYLDSDGTQVPAVVPLGGCNAAGKCGGTGSGGPGSPYAYTPLSPGQHNLAISTVGGTALTIPTGAAFASVCNSVAATKYTTDGTTTPTASIGQPFAPGACVWFTGGTVLSNSKFFSTTGTLDVEYFK